MNFAALTDIFSRNVEGTAQNVVAGVVAAGFGIWLGTKLGKRKAIAAITSGKMDGDDAIMGHTRYVPTGIINPNTGEEIYEQQIRNQESRLSLREIFHASVQIQMMHFLKDAKDLCTEEEPLVFQHLSKVVPPKLWPQTKEVLITQWVSALAEVMTDTPQTVRNQIKLNERQKEVEGSVLPLLVYEPGAAKRQERILLIYFNKKGEYFLPAEENVRFSVSHHRDRLKTNNRIMKALENPDLAWIKQRTTIRVPTGEIIEIPTPDKAIA